MKTKHTPEPWEVIYDGQLNGEPDPCWQASITDSNNEEIAVVWGKTEEECKANADLAALSPEMLKAINLLLNSLDTLKGKSPLVYHSISIAKKVIKKVTS